MSPVSDGPLADTARVDAVERALGYVFRDRALALRALRHASVGGADGSDNERLEFLGDALLGLATASDLFGRHPEASEGELTERRARLVSRARLASLARQIGLEPLIELRPAPAPGTPIPASVLAGALEALLGAVHLDGGFSAARDATLSILKEEGPENAAENAKSALQHFVQPRFGCVPGYRVVEERLHPFGRTFCVAVEVGERRFAPAWGRSKREAEQLAAREALLELRE